MIGRNDPCWCGSGQKWKRCHAPQLPLVQSHQQLADKYLRSYRIRLKTPEEIEGIRRACKLSAGVLAAVSAEAQAGVTTDALNSLAHQMITGAGARPAALNYGNPPFPKSICLSLNEVICHGIADQRPLEEGDIMNIDVACELDGYYGDCSGMVTIGAISEERRLVVDTALECLEKAIAICKPGVMIREIGTVITNHAEGRGCSVVTAFVAHGVGIDFHEPPQVPHCRNEVNIPMAAGMTFTIEPMINAGVPDAEIDPVDQWTARTADGRASAQWEHTLLITPSGHEVLTQAG